jgi:signal transduction histidine kinase/HPt (histidine-containing phosphotransfer) domain-containing protein
MSGYRLLIVDDDPTDRRIIAEALAQIAPDTCRIQLAADGVAALAALRTDEFDCVLLDYNLPDMNALEFLTAAAVDGEQPCAVVLVTGQGNEAVAVEAMKRGVQDYLVKDQVNAESLWRTLTRAVSKQQRQQRLAGSLSDLRSLNLALEQEAVTRKVAEAEAWAARDAAERASQAKTRFIAMVSHELRTPLNGVLGYAQLLRIEGGLSTRQDTHVGAMIQAGRNLLDLIERVLDFASFESGRVRLFPAVVPVRDLAEACIGLVGPMAVKRGLKLRVVQSHDVPRQIVADPSRLRQVLVNLLGNAIKYTDAGSVELRLSAGGSPGGLRVEIADTGRGISEASRDCLFKDFERLDETTSVEGAGLGLAIAARIVGLMGGTVRYLPNSDGADPNGTNPSGGSVFWFELPAGALVSTPVSSPVQSVPAASIRNVLLVDDIQINRDIIGAFLKAAGHVVTLADSGSEAIRLATGQQFDVVLMDVRMPEMDGMEATRRIRALPGSLGQMPILALTAHTFPDQVAKYAEAGMDAHIAKPVDYETLINAVHQAVRRVPPPQNKARPAPPATDLPPAQELPPRFDHSALDRLFTMLPRDEIVVILGSLRERQKEMLHLLDQGAAPALLADVAHGLTSSAAIFGFLALSTLARNFECAVTQDAARAEQLVAALRAELCVARRTLDAVMNESRMQPAGSESIDTA